MNHGEMNTGDLFKNREMDTGETTILKLVPDFELAMETKERKEEMKGVVKRMKEFIGEKNIYDLNLRELIEMEKRLEAHKNVKNHVKEMTREMRDIMIMKEFARFRIGEIEDKVFKPQDEFDILLEAYDIKGKGLHVKGLKMRMKVFIEEKETEDVHLEELIEFHKKLEALQPKSVDKMHMKDMTEETKDVIVMNEIVKKMIAKVEKVYGSSSQTKIISNYF